MEVPMPASQKAAISFGLVHIPVELYVATQDNEIHFNQLVKGSNKRVRYKKTDGDKPVTNEQIVKGYQYEKDKYIIIDNADIEKIKTPKDSAVEIVQFVDQKTIPSVYYNKAYYVLPVKGGEKAFELLRTAMQEKGKVAIGKTVLGTKETLLALISNDKGILMQTMFFHDEVREVPKETPHPKIEKKELDMALLLMDSMDRPFMPQEYRDEYQERLRAMIEDKIEGREIAVPKAEKGGNVISLMDALQKSLQQGKPAKKTPSRPASRKKSGAK